MFILGILIAVLGGMIFMGGAMSDAPTKGAQAAKIGSVVCLIGLALIGYSIFKMVHH